MDYNEALRIMKLNQRIYDSLAEDFAQNRPKIAHEFTWLADYFKDGDKVLDLGCGNGRFFELLTSNPGKKISYFGADSSEKLIGMARKNFLQGQFVATDGLQLPFAEDFFDGILCISVLHHLPSYELRREFLRQAFRVLKKEGMMVLAAWHLKSRRYYWKLLIKYFWLKISGKSKLEWGDVFEPWGEGVSGVRFIHSFSQKELKSLFEEVGFKVESVGLLTRKSGKKNWVVIARK